MNKHIRHWKKKIMIQEILEYSEIYSDEKELKRLSPDKIKIVYYACLIPVFKKLKIQKVKL